MEKKTIKTLFVNGGPRKNKNTAQMLESAMKGAKDAGAEVELVHLYDLDFKRSMPATPISLPTIPAMP